MKKHIALVVIFLLMCIVVSGNPVTRVRTIETVDNYPRERTVDLTMNPTNVFSASGMMYSTNQVEVAGSKDNIVLLTNDWLVAESTPFFGISGEGLKYTGEPSVSYAIDANATVRFTFGINQNIFLYIGINGTPILGTASLVEMDKGIDFFVSTQWEMTLNSNDVVQIFVENRAGSDEVDVVSANLRVRR